MTKVAPFHSKLPDAQAYHDQAGCMVGDNIESCNTVSGQDGLCRCVICEALDRPDDAH